MWNQVEDELRLGRVRMLTNEGKVLHIDLGDGDFATATTSGPSFPFAPNDWIYVRASDGHLSPAPPELGEGNERFPGGSPSVRIGVVVMVGESELIISGRGGLESVPRRKEVVCHEAYTVAYSSDGVERVIAKRQLSAEKVRSPSNGSRYLRHPQDDDPTYDDYAGNDETLRRARELLETPLRETDRLREIGTPGIRGVLLTGPPGTGKTMLARVIAKESDAAFYEVSGPEIVSKWVGESERDLRDLFLAAEAEPRAIIFFDEIDSIAGRRGVGSNEHDQRLVAQFLTVLDGMSRKGNVIVLAATNRPEALEPALRRPGRFDWEIEFGLPSEEDREAILRASSRRVRLGSDVDLRRLAKDSEFWTPADLASLWTEAGLWAARDGRGSISQEDVDAAHHRRMIQVRTTLRVPAETT